MDNAPPTTHRISEFAKWDKEKCLNLAPPFQRKPVWSEKTKSNLIETIIRQLPVPEIYIQVKTNRQGKTEYVVVDGQQRIRAILSFIEGEFALADDATDYPGKEFSGLPEGIIKDFWNYSVVTRELKTEKETDVREIFQRINKNMVPLNSQELRNAAYDGHFIKLMNELSEDSFWADNKIVSPQDIKRMRDAEFISELFVSMMKGLQNKKDSLDDCYQLYDKIFNEKEEKRKEFIKIQNVISDIFGDDLRSSAFKDKIDFYSLFNAVAELNREYVFPAQNYAKIKTSLMDFGNELTVNREDSSRTLVKKYALAAIKGNTDLGNRKIRHEVVRQIFVPFLIPKDQKRAFTDEERRIMWALSADKKCPLCGLEVKWDDYDLDHKRPHSQGGKTLLENAQIMHASCNRTKGKRCNLPNKGAE